MVCHSPPLFVKKNTETACRPTVTAVGFHLENTGPLVSLVFGKLLCDRVWYDVISYGMVSIWYGVIWYGMV